MKELKKSIWLISIPLSFIGFIFPIYAIDLGVSTMEMGYLYSMLTMISIIIPPIVGNLIDKEGRKSGILIGTFLYIIMNLFFIMANDFRYLLIGRILQGLAASFLWISMNTAISDISNRDNRGENFGSMNQLMAKGQWVGSMIGFTILYKGITEDPFKTVFTIFLGTSLMSLYHTIKKVPETIHLKKEKDFQQGMIKDKRQFRYFLLIMATISFITSLTTPIFILYLQENITKDIGLILYLFIPSSILSVFLPKIFGGFSDRYDRGKIIMAGLFLNGLLQIVIPLNKSYYSFMILYSLISTVVMLYGPALSSIIIDFVGEDERGKSYGLYSFASGIGAVIGPIVGSYIYDNMGNNIVFYMKGLFMIVMTFFLYYIYNNKLNTGKLGEIGK